MLCCAVMACKKIDVSFTYAPEAPRAGESVRFSNLSSGGQNWEWTFGDGSSSTLKSPSHVYKKPGTYRVLLKVDNKNGLTATQEVTVYDTIPTFTCPDSMFYIFQDYTFTANLYNPYNYEVEYAWSFPINTEYVRLVDANASLNKSSITVYFEKPMEAAPLFLEVKMNDEITLIEQWFAVQDVSTNSLLIRAADGDYRQRIFGERAEKEKKDADATVMLDLEQDTFQVYNNYWFYLSDLAEVFPGIQGFHIANRKIYYRADGLWVANIDGTNRVQIDPFPCTAMTLDMLDNRIYWADEDGVWYMPFVGSDNNKFVTEPEQLNELPGVTVLSADNNLK